MGMQPDSKEGLRRQIKQLEKAADLKEVMYSSLLQESGRWTYENKRLRGRIKLLLSMNKQLIEMIEDDE